MRAEHQAGEMMNAGLRAMLIAAPHEAPLLQPHTMGECVHPLSELDLQLPRTRPVQVRNVSDRDHPCRLHELRLGGKRPQGGWLEGVKVIEQVAHQRGRNEGVRVKSELPKPLSWSNGRGAYSPFQPSTLNSQLPNEVLRLQT
jgi:hypothetical protein